MDKLFVRKDVYEELLEKGFGKKDYSKLTKKKITDKNGHTRTVFVRNGEQPAAQKQPKAQEGLSDEKRAKYEEMLEKVKAGSDENALFVQGKMLNKKEAIAHLEAKLGKKTDSVTKESGIPIQGSNWISLPSGTRVTNEGAKEKMTRNNERIETLKKLMEGNTKADNFRLNSELRSLQNENEYIASRLPPEKEETKNETPHGYILNNLTDEEKNKIYDLFKDAEFTKQLDSKLEFRLDDKAGEMILKKMPHGALKSKIYELASEYNRENFKDASDYKNGLPGEAMGQLYKEYKNKPSQNDMKTEKKSSKELKKEIEDLRSEYREKYDSLSAKEKDEYVKKFDKLEAEIDKAETEETGMNKFERRGYEGTMDNKWLDKTKLPQIKENAEAKIKGYENLLNDLKNDKTKKNSVQRESYEVNLAIAQDNLDEWKGKLKAINEMMEKASKKNTSETKDSVNGFTLDDISHIGDGKTRDQTKFINDMETAKGVVEMIAKKYGATKKGREQLMDFIALNIGGSNPLYDKLYEEYGIDADDLDMDFEASHDLILNQAMGKDTQKNREQIADSKSDFERRYRQMLESED